MKPFVRTFTAMALLAAAGDTLAHSGPLAVGFASGWLHPFGGMDHLLAMVAVGLWAAQSEQAERLWLLPLTFMGALTAGMAAGTHAPALAPLEWGIAASLTALGLALALARPLPLAAAVLAVASFGLLHGYAHGVELPQAAAPAPFAAGMLCATAALHLTGILLGRIARRHRRPELLRIAGVGVAAAGLGLLGMG